MLVKVENGKAVEWPLAEHYLQTAHPETSFSFPLSDETLSKFGFARFQHSDPPAFDPELQIAKEIAPEIKGLIATQSWVIEEKYSKEEKAEYLAEREKQEAEYSATLYQHQRAAEYPAIGDQLDALFHAGVFPAEMAAKIQAVKDAYPKPK